MPTHQLARCIAELFSRLERAEELFSRLERAEEELALFEGWRIQAQERILFLERQVAALQEELRVTGGEEVGAICAQHDEEVAR